MRKRAMAVQIITTTKSDSYASISAAADALRDGALVVFPTETTYGVAANAAQPEAMRRLRTIKGRHDARPFTVHLGQPTDARCYVSAPSPIARRLARRAWPGPLTLVCGVTDPGQTEFAARHAAALDEVFFDGAVGLRCPAHPAAEQLLRASNAPIVASSANRRGGAPALDFGAALEALGQDVDYAIDGGPTRYRAASTIVRVGAASWSIERVGALEERTVARLARSETLMVCTGNSCRSPLAEYVYRRELAQALGVDAAQLAELGYFVSSAGASAYEGAPMSAGSLQELSQRGIDGAAHRSQPLTVERIQRCERIYGMTEAHRAAVLELAPGAADRVALLDAHGPVEDPIGGGQEDYRRCAEQIERATKARVKEQVDEDRDW